MGDVFSYDGSRERDKVVVAVNSLGEGKLDRYFGHQVYDDTIKELLGHGLSDEELDEESKKTNALTIDHIFCSECEKRFSVLEDWYAEILKGNKDYPPQIPYLFWMSVVWRMAKRQIPDLAWGNGRSIWNIGRSQQKTLSKMHPLPFDGANESGDIPLWMNSENPAVINIPRSLRKIENWLEEHQNKEWTIEEASEELGHSPGEMKVMTDYWAIKENERLKKVESGERIMEALKELVGRV